MLPLTIIAEGFKMLELTNKTKGKGMPSRKARWLWVPEMAFSRIEPETGDARADT